MRRRGRTDIGLRLAGLVGHDELVADRVARRVEEAAAAVLVAPALEDQALGVVAQEEELLERFVGDRCDIGPGARYAHRRRRGIRAPSALPDSMGNRSEA
jgi:hypothetical protein